MVDVVSDQTELSYAESVTGWSGDSFTLDTEIKVQGNNSVSCIQTANGANDAIFSGSWDFTGGVTLRMYLNSNIMANTHTEANNGIQLFITGGTTAYFTVGGSDTYGGGWRDFYLDTSSTPTSGSFTANAVTAIGVRINTSTKPRNATNGWYDNWRYGSGLEINSTTTEAIDFTDVAADDGLVANKYDILENIEETLQGKGSLTLGNAAGSKNCNLVSVNEQISFLDRVVATDLYGIIGTEGTGNTDIDIQGLVCKTNGTTGAEFDFSATINSFSMSGSTLINMGLVKFAQGTVDLSSFSSCGATTISGATAVAGCTWSSSGLVTLSGTSSATLCNFLPLTGVDAVSTDSLAKVSDCSFTSGGTGHAVILTSLGAGTMSWDNDTSGYAGSDGSTGNEDIYVNVGSGSLTINVAEGRTTPTIRTAGATITVVSGSVNIDVNVKDQAAANVASALVYIDEDLVTAGNIANTTTNASGNITTATYNGAATTATLRVRKYGYKPYVGTITLLSNTATNITLITDPQQT